MFKIALVLCAQAFLIQTVFSTGLNGCGCGNGIANGFGNLGCGVSSTGGNFPVASSSPYPPLGISVQSENYYEGELCVNGNLPFLGTVALEGVLPTQGSSTVSYGCGNGNVGITDENALGGIGRGCGCGRL